MIYRCRRPVLVAFVYLATANLVIAAQEPTPDREPNLTDEQKEDFLRCAKVVAGQRPRDAPLCRLGRKGRVAFRFRTG